MKRNRLLTLSLLTIVSFFVLQSWSGGYNGARVADNPTTGCSGSGCHGTATQASTLSILMKDLNGNIINTYVPDSTYQVEIKLSKQLGLAAARAGFQSIITDPIGTNVGTFTVDMPSQVTQAVGPPAVPVMMHNTSLVGPISDLSGVVTWTYLWKAPLFGAGNITIHVVANDANGTGTSAGDNIVWGNAPVIQGSPASINDLSKDVKAIYPNPTLNSLNIDLVNASKSTLQIFSAAGQLMKSQTFNTNKLNIDMSNLSAGNYFINLEQNGKTAKRAIIKL